MTTTTNLDITHWAESQDQPYVTLNEGMNILDGAVAGTVTVDMGGNADYTLDTSTGDPPYEWQYLHIDITNTGTALTAQRNINVPAQAHLYVIYNNNGAAFDLNIQVTGGGGAGELVAHTKRAILYCDGTDVIRLTADI